MISVSVIIPVYNGEKYIEKCLVSIREQLLENIEIIIINDGSTDKTKELCENSALNDNRIKVYTINNNGVSYARNKGMEYAVGRYITFVDADDYIDKNMYDDMFNLAIKDDADMIVCGIKCKSIRGLKDFSVSYETKILYETEIKNEVMSNLCFDTILWNSPCNKLYKTEFIKKNKYFFSTKLKRGEDLKFNREIIPCIKTLIVLPDNYYYYNLNNNSAMRSIIKKYSEIYLNQYKSSIEFINKYNINTKEVLDRLLQNTFMAIIMDIKYICSFSVSANILHSKVLIKNLLNNKMIQDIVNSVYCDTILKKIIKYLIKEKSIWTITLFGNIYSKMIWPLKILLKKIIIIIKYKGKE